MTDEAQVPADWEISAYRLAARDPQTAIRSLVEYRRRLWRAGWWAEARDATSSAFVIAETAGRFDIALQHARWSVKHFSSADSYMTLGEALSKSGRSRAAHSAWTRAASMADKAGQLLVAETARARLAGAPLRRDLVAMQELLPHAWKVAEADVAGALDLLAKHRGVMLRCGARRDASDALRLSVHLCLRHAFTVLGRRLARRLVAETPSAEAFRLLAELERKAGRLGPARTLALRAKRLARKEGSRKELVLAEQIVTETASKPRPDGV